MNWIYILKCEDNHFYDEEKQSLYFRCAKKNTWHKMRDIFDIDDEPCNFFMKYTQDDDYKREINDKYQEINSLTRRSHWLTNLTDAFYEYCLGGCGKEYDSNTTIRYNKKAINLCFDCFINKNTELAKYYNSLQQKSNKPLF